MAHPFTLRLWTVLVLLSMGLTACAGAPVQEMSNARQAIKAARDAGADKAAPDKLTEAEALLERAEQSLQKRDYRDARRDAIAARSKASQALHAVQPGARNGVG
jgi:predicted S18 family serine protease